MTAELRSGPDRVLEARILHVDCVTGRVTAELDAAGIDSMLLKGPVFERLFYAGGTGRVYTDTDLLVALGDREGATNVLRRCGFLRFDRDEDQIGQPKYAHTFKRLSDGAMVDLHWTLSGAQASPEQVWMAMREHTIEMRVGGRRLVAADALSSALLVALHNAHHGNRRPTTLEDLDRAIERLELATWREAAALAAQLGAASRFAAGLRLTEAGDALADRLSLERPASVEMWLKTNPSADGAWVLSRFIGAPTLRQRARLALFVALPSRPVMHKFVPLARRGRVGLALAYLVRPTRLLARAGPALRDLRRARQAVRSTAQT